MESRLHVRDGTYSTLEREKVEDTGTLPTPVTGDDTPLALVIDKIECEGDKKLKFEESQVI
jgi:hypothetical protein